MYKILDKWWGWLLFIIIIRLLFSFFEEPLVTPEEFTIKTLVTNLQNSSDKDIQKISEETLQESVLALPEYRDFIVSELERASKNSPQAKKIEQFVEKIQQNPLFRIHVAVDRPNFPIVFYLEPLLFAIPIIFAILFMAIIPLFMEYVVGHRSTVKLYGRKGKKFFYILIVVTWFAAIFLFYQEMALYSHMTLVIFSLLFLFLITYKKFLALFLNISQKNTWLIFLSIFCLGVASFLPYFSAFIVSSNQTIQISQENLHKAIVELESDDYSRAVPLLKNILQNKIYQTEPIINAIFEILSKTSDKDSLTIIAPYLSHSNPLVQKKAMETVLQIIKKKK